MKQIKYSVLTAIITLTFTISTVWAMPNFVPAYITNPHGDIVADVVIPEHAIEVAPHVFSLGTAADIDGTIVEGYAIVHPAQKSIKPGKASRGIESSKKLPVCYSFLASGARWKVTESYLLNPANADGLSNAFVENAITAGTDEWESYAGYNIFGSGITTSDTLKADLAFPDGKNEVYFGALTDPNVIAVTYVWGTFGGAPQNRKLSEWDMVFNDSGFSWGDAKSDPAIMDLLNIAVHEIGHAAGLGHPSDSCTEETMFRFSSEGETKKRDLNTGDIAGITKLYK